MALQLTRALRRLATVPLYRSSVQGSRYASTKPAEDDVIPGDMEQATGLEKKELEALMEGKEDPFNMSVNAGPRGTRDTPTLVPSMFEERIVGCICDEEATFITWQVVKKGDTHRCECGQYYQLVEANPTKINNLY